MGRTSQLARRHSLRSALRGDSKLVGRRLLFVDDDPNVRRVFARSLEYTGLDIHLASTPKMALQMAAEVQYPLIVTDLQMPGMNGIELVDRLWQTNPTTSFVLITGISELNLPSNSPSARSIACMLRKPWLPEQVHAALLQAWDLHLVRSQAKSDERNPSKDTQTNILLVESEGYEASSVLDTMAGLDGLRVKRLTRLGASLQALKDDHHDLILTDLSLPDARGLDAISGLRRAAPTTPIIVLSAGDDEDLAMQAVRGGAQDYLRRSDLSPQVLERSIRYAMERKDTEEHLSYLAHHDQLTGLANRTLFCKQASRTIFRECTMGVSPSVMVLDLDNFKNTNNVFGHGIGDLLLVQVSKRLSGVLGDGETVARLGGDEFALLLRGSSTSEGPSHPAQRILDALREPFVINGNHISISASIGISVFPKNGNDIDQLLSNADAAMYRAKDGGRNRYQFFDQSMHVKALEWMETESQLRGALERNEFSLHYQPQVRCTDDKVVSFEALLRWNHPKLGQVSPGRFIPVLESIGLIEEVGGWVLRQACRQLARWRRHDPKLRMAVNVSAIQFEDPTLVYKVATSIESSGLPPEALELEITESLVMRDFEQTLSTLTRLKELGVGIAIDDFGTGYSNLASLARLPIDVLKIDRSITSLIGDEKGESIPTAVIQLSQALDIDILAEGVEEREELDFLQAKGVQTYQGYFFARPLSVSDLEERLELGRSKKSLKKTG